MEDQDPEPPAGSPRRRIFKAGFASGQIDGQLQPLQEHFHSFLLFNFLLSCGAICQRDTGDISDDTSLNPAGPKITSRLGEDAARLACTLVLTHTQTGTAAGWMDAQAETVFRLHVGARCA